nr:hypothetical protein Itr_chr05CG01220 [Ipomoea trifida]
MVSTKLTGEFSELRSPMQSLPSKPSDRVFRLRDFQRCSTPPEHVQFAALIPLGIYRPKERMATRIPAALVLRTSLRLLCRSSSSLIVRLSLDEANYFEYDQA